MRVIYSCTAGGTFALYSLLSRHANIGIIPSRDQVDEKLTTYSRSRFSENSFAAKTKRWLEGHACAKNALLVLVLVGSCMVIGDGILTPAISGMLCLFIELVELFSFHLNVENSWGFFNTCINLKYCLHISIDDMSLI